MRRRISFTSLGSHRIRKSHQWAWEVPAWVLRRREVSAAGRLRPPAELPGQHIRDGERELKNAGVAGRRKAA